MTDDKREYLTAAEFAALPSRAQHAVWQAHKDGLVDSVPASRSAGGPLRYHRAQVEALLEETGVAR